MDKTFYSEEVLRRFKDFGYEHYVLPWEKRSISRPQAMEKLQSMIERPDQSLKTADFVAEVEAAFTSDSVKVLPPNEKRTIRLAAEAAGNEKVLNWIRAATQDQENCTWEVRAETPRPPVDVARIMFRDLTGHIEASELHTPIQMINTLFDLLEAGSSDNQNASDSSNATISSQPNEQATAILGLLRQQQPRQRRKRGFRNEWRILDLTVVSEANATTNQQLREELCSTTKLLEQQQAREITWKTIEDSDSEYIPSEDGESEDDEFEYEAYASRKRLRLDPERKIKRESSW
ncbi:hypothetical protein MKX08_005377 [Trichoderma sp. CBMAI-0020]|nr:hypothetical protein MKX08_005377 [Trichoderma sp. CBMAI-0020]